MKDLETMQREGREGFRQDFTSDCEGYIDCIKGQLDKLDQHTASTWKAAQESMNKSILESGLLEQKETPSSLQDPAGFCKAIGHNTLARDIKEFISNMDTNSVDSIHLNKQAN